MTVLCQSCGFDRSSGQSYAYWMDGVSLRSRVVSPWLGRRARSVAAGALQAGAAGGVKAEIWANLRLHGEEIVALNPWHLQAMRAYIAPLVRPECCAESVASQDWRTRLPDWMKLGANRKAVLTVLDRLRRRLDDGA